MDMSRMVAVMESAFRFNIGQLVGQRIDLGRFEQDLAVNGAADFDGVYHRLGIPTALIVVERMVQQCHGGIQLFYCIRGQEDRLYRLIEHELVPYEEVTAAIGKLRKGGKTLTEALTEESAKLQETARVGWRERMKAMEEEREAFQKRMQELNARLDALEAQTGFKP